MTRKESLEPIQERTKETPPKPKKMTFRQAIRDTLYQMAQNEQAMNEAKEKNPQLYDLTMKVYFEEKERREQK